MLLSFPIPSLLLGKTAEGISPLEGVLLVPALGMLLLASHTGDLPTGDGRITMLATVGLEIALTGMLLTAGVATIGVRSSPVLLGFLASLLAVYGTSTVLGVDAFLEARTRSVGWALLAAWPLLTLVLLGVFVGTGVGTIVLAVVLPAGLAWTRLGHESVRREVTSIDDADRTSNRSSD